MHGFTLDYMAVEAIRHPLVQEGCSFTMVGFTIGIHRSGGKIMPGDQFLIIMATTTGLRDIERTSTLVQTGGDMVVESEDK